MATFFEPVSSSEQTVHLAKMAFEIWNEYWPAHIGQAQTDYMVKNFQSLEAIKHSMAQDAYEYWFICSDSPTAREEEHAKAAGGEGSASEKAHLESTSIEPRIVGYTGGHIEPETNRFFISKIYLYAEERGKGYASKVIDFYENLCRERGLRAMYLTVNKYNDLGVRAYLGKGFETIDSVETDIGEGFIMDDFIMEKSVLPSAQLTTSEM